MHDVQNILNATKKNAILMIKENLAESDAWVFRAVSALYERQTSSEQAAGHTTDHNRVGFSALDSGLLSSFAVQVNDWNKTPAHLRKYDTPLSEKQSKLARRLVSKYSGQILSMMVVRAKGSQAVAA